MPSESRADRPIETLQELSARVVATSGEDRPRDVLERLLGAGENLSSIPKALAQHDITLRARDFFQDEKTRHQLHYGNGVEYLPCVGDAFGAAVLIEEDPVTVRSIDPVSEETVLFEISDSEFTVTPSQAVVSLGMRADLPDAANLPRLMIAASRGEELPGGHDPEAGPHLTCRYINAFETREHFERWTSEVDSISVALRPEDLMAMARHLTPRLASGSN